MEKADSLPLGTPIMAPLGDVLYRGVITEPREDHATREGMVCVEFTPPVERPVHFLAAAGVGAGAGFISGLTGVGGGVFLTPVLIAAGWVSPRRAAALSPPFILCNSVVGLIGARLVGQTLAPGTLLYSVGALAGAVAGTAIGLRRMSERTTRYVLAIILLFAGVRLLLR
jgi:uncharacterized membrane protein YfcA